jgi:hypothetical protein
MSAQPNKSVDLLPTPRVPQYSEYREMAHEIGLSAAQLSALIALFERDYPRDIMLRELHVPRACMSIRRGDTTIGDVLRPAGEAA